MRGMGYQDRIELEQDRAWRTRWALRMVLVRAQVKWLLRRR